MSLYLQLYQQLQLASVKVIICGHQCRKSVVGQGLDYYIYLLSFMTYKVYLNCFALLLVGMSKNPNFLEEVSSQFGKDDKIIVVSH